MAAVPAFFEQLRQSITDDKLDALKSLRQKWLDSGGTHVPEVVLDVQDSLDDDADVSEEGFIQHRETTTTESRLNFIVK